MARKTASRVAKRKEVEAAEAAESAGTKTATKKKKATRKKAVKKTATKSRARRVKDTLERRKLVWLIYSQTMKEEARFAWEDKRAAEEKLEQLRAKSKRLYFLQPLKEPIVEAPVEEPKEEAK